MTDPLVIVKPGGVALPRTNIRDRIELAPFNNLDLWQVKNTDTANMALDTKHVIGINSLIFDKVNTGADDVEAAIENGFNDSIDASRMLPSSNVSSMLYLSSLANVVNAFIRIGSDASNYNQWTFPSAGLVAGEWNQLQKKIMESDFIDAGFGWKQDEILYVSLGITFEDQADTLVGIRFDNLILTGQ